MVRRDTVGISDLDDLRGKQVAVMQGDNAEEFLRRKERGIEIITTATFETALDQLALGYHDAVVMQRLVALRRRVAERNGELRESEEFNRTIMDNLPMGVAVNSLNPEVKFSYMNDNFPRLYGTTREALLAGDFWETIYEDQESREKIKKRVLADCASGDPQRMF